MTYNPKHKPLSLSKADARRAMARHHFSTCDTQMAAFDRLRSIQFDPIAPVGCNHDLVLQARVPGYRVGDWQKVAYADRLVYDGWDKQASLVPFEGWPWRRWFHQRYQPKYEKLLTDYADGVAAILKEIEERGPMLPRESGFQERKEEWKSHWYSPNVTKHILRALWHTGRVMTVGRKNGHHIYDLAERVVPKHLREIPLLSEPEAVRELVLERHRAVGFVRPSASYEMWSYTYAPVRNTAIKTLVAEGELVPVDIEGIKAHATPAFLTQLDQPALEPRVVFVAPLDQLLWDRVMVQGLFGFDYVWEIYTPEAKRRWGYYVLPVLYGDRLVARAEFFCRKGVLEMRSWLYEPGEVEQGFFPALERALGEFMAYSSATKIEVADGVDGRVKELGLTAKPASLPRC